jgi:site-specific recombinase XerD
LSGLRQMIRRVYRRCGFPARWTGVHRLRHSFATRLFRHGADPKQIADLLGHRGLGSTDTYVQADLTALRTLVRPWPFQNG